MLTQICLDYGGLPDPRTLKASEIRFFYDGLRKELRSRTQRSDHSSSNPVSFRKYT
jgi:hypothetical protein